MVLCLQLCPLRKGPYVSHIQVVVANIALTLSYLIYTVLYACVGVRMPSAVTPIAPALSSKKSNLNEATLAAAALAADAAKSGPPFTAPGEWAISRTPLSEEERRLLITLSAQHAVWCEDVTRFIAKYGDCLTTHADVEGAESTHSESKVRKTESALEERLRALLSDMERAVDRVLGPKSECGEFLSDKYKGCIADLSRGDHQRPPFLSNLALKRLTFNCFVFYSRWIG